MKGVCDLQKYTCPESVTSVTCTKNNGYAELQQAVTKCTAGSRCYLRLAASTRCDSVKIDGKDVCIDGDSDASIVPQSDGAVAVSVVATKTEMTRVGLAGIRSAEFPRQQESRPTAASVRRPQRSRSFGASFNQTMDRG